MYTVQLFYNASKGSFWLLQTMILMLGLIEQVSFDGPGLWEFYFSLALLFREGDW